MWVVIEVLLCSIQQTKLLLHRYRYVMSCTNFACLSLAMYCADGPSARRSVPLVSPALFLQSPLHYTQSCFDILSHPPPVLATRCGVLFLIDPCDVIAGISFKNYTIPCWLQDSALPCTVVWVRVRFRLCFALDCFRLSHGWRVCKGP